MIGYTVFALCVSPAAITLGLMRLNNPRVLVSVLCLVACAVALAQSPSQRNPDVSNKGLITKSTPGINADAFKNQSVSAASAALHRLADDYYTWRNENYPVHRSRTLRDVGWLIIHRYLASARSTCVRSWRRCVHEEDRWPKDR
jgi:hypothetical protein